MANILARQVGPLPVGGWAVLVAGGALVAWRATQTGPKVTRTVEEVPVPVGAIAANDGAPLVMSPVVRINVPEIDTLTGAITENTEALGTNTGALGTNTGALGTNTGALKDNTTAVTGLTKATRDLAKQPTTTTTKKATPKAPAKKATRKYTIKSGDTLSAIAKRYTGSASRWPELYRANAAKIDSVARSRGKSGGGHWIFPGTVLVIPW